MKKILFLAALVLAAMQATATNVDLVTAQQSAQRFLMNNAAKGKIMATKPNIQWTQEVKNSNNAAQTAYYIVNTDRGYVIVPGDDRAREVLAYGDMPLKDMNNIPENMQFFLDMYKAEMEYLQAHPGQTVKIRNANLGQSVEPMLTTLWQQGSNNGRSPYNRLCPKTGGLTSLVGCAAVSLAQVMNYWKYPAGSPALPAYTGERGVYVPALPAYTFDWDHMRNTYKNENWTEEERDAISNLMRYIGQAEFMDYDPQMSGADEDQMLMAMRLFGYDPSAHYVLKNDYDRAMTELYNDDDWTTMMQSELIAGRPLMYCAYSATSAGDSYYGHAFNVDGYNSTNDTYHVNFGQSEERNGWYAFNAFGYGITIYKYFQLMFLDVKPLPEGVSPSARIVAHTIVNQPEADLGSSVNTKIDVIGADLTGDITVTVTDENGFLTTDVNTIALSDLDAANHKVINATYAPTDDAGMHYAYITLTSPGAEPLYIYFYSTANGVSEKMAPVMLPAKEDYITANSFRADWHHMTDVELVKSYTLDVNGTLTTNILNKSFNVEGLAAGTYTFKVKAIYEDGTESAWSNAETVTLGGSSSHNYELGDVNHDGIIGIADATTVIDYILDNSTEICAICADVTNDGIIGIADVTSIIDMILSK